MVTSIEAKVVDAWFEEKGFKINKVQEKLLDVVQWFVEHNTNNSEPIRPYALLYLGLHQGHTTLWIALEELYPEFIMRCPEMPQKNSYIVPSSFNYWTSKVDDRIRGKLLLFDLGGTSTPYMHNIQKAPIFGAIYS
jgi:hypothetical protein